MTKFVTYDMNSTQAIKYFDSESSAKRSATCANKRTGVGVGVVAYASLPIYNTLIVTKKTVRNIMSGALVEIDSNTPRCCDPSSELYWSM